ncbi:RNA polymerase sigma factor [Streptomyces fructofermentans]|uniref:DNA-directed RNA polymerase sigma-70 factor n=1 Tax=Streptomyces fructofermentans TaxID=152141 RepID=A0A918U207_9ACTN|nr:RNA polymerase sigma factor [Streptomyces fructofermentans]GGX82892.1 DNA-directed RNA polymerase sigma-70 factor [Streptomyces fructofermentans]
MSRPMDNSQGFEDVYRRTYLPVLRFLRRRLPSTAAEDAAAEVFLVAWRNRHELRGKELPWLYGIARRVAANTVRSSDRAGRLDSIRAHHDGGTAPAAEDAVLYRLGAQGVLDRLPAQEQEVLLLVAWDGLSVRDAARVLGCSAGAFRVRMHRARRMLEAAVAADEMQISEVGLPVDGRTR